MALLHDRELVRHIVERAPAIGDRLIVDDLPPPPVIHPPAAGAGPNDAWYQKASPVQAASVDLHVGEILIPGTKEGDPGSTIAPCREKVLECGQTALVVSLETLTLPKDLAAIGFPPAEIASRGLLMINAGHIDPGFKGRLRFTVINVGKSPISLWREQPIFTLLFLRLEGAAEKGWLERRQRLIASPPTQPEVDKLSPDFLNIEGRADSAAKKAVNKAALKAPIITGVLSFFGAIVVGFVTFYLTLWSDIRGLKNDVGDLNTALDIKARANHVETLRAEIVELKKALEDVRAARKAGSAGAKP